MGNINIQKIIEDAKKISKDDIKSVEIYLRSYPEFLKHFSNVECFDKHNIIIGTHLVYGWMPTIIKLRSENYCDIIPILNQVKDGEIIDSENIDALKKFINNSIVGASKLLHFINPENYAIWDSRVCNYLKKNESISYKVDNINSYQQYLKFCRNIAKDNQYNEAHEIIEKLVGYKMSNLRTIELIMFLNGKKNES